MKSAVCILAFLAAPLAAQFQVREIEKGRFEVTEHGRPVLIYNASMRLDHGAPADKTRCCYLHPVYTPKGTAVTDDFPKDHWHHRGIFWAWPIVKVGGQVYDQWLVKGANPRPGKVRYEVSPTSAKLEAECSWYATQQPIVQEKLGIEVMPAEGSRREMRFRLVLEASGEPVILRGESGQNKGYGGFSVRFAPRQDTTLWTDAGRDEKDTDMVPHPWAELRGRFQDRYAALRIEIDRANPGAPNGWCLRHYGFLGVNFPGREDFTLQPGQPLVLRYKVIVSDLN